MLNIDQLEALAERVKGLTDSDREVDALVTLALLARPTANPRIATLIAQPSQPVCMFWDQSFKDHMVKRLEQQAKDYDEDLIYFEYDEKWLHFVTRTVPYFTSDIDAGLANLPAGFSKWKMDSSGAATLWNEDARKNILFENTIPAISLTGAILKAKIFLLRDLNEREPEARN